jgi:CRISPR-associated protein Cas2
MPSHEPQFTLICFDVAHDHRRRARVARELENVGSRVQKSVFEAWLTPAQRKTLLQRLARVLDQNLDKLEIHVLRPLDVARIRDLAGITPTRNAAYAIV